MRKLFVYATVISGIAAAYLMLRRGESLVNVASKTLQNPIGTLAHEVKEAL